MNFFNSLNLNKSLFISILGFSFVFTIAQLLQTDLLFDRNAINSGQWWKLLSGNFTHSNIAHLLLNLSGLWILGFLFIDTLSSKTFIFSTIFLSVFVGLGLFLYTPEINRYYGFSGILYGLYFISAVNAILKNDVFTGASVASLISGKIFWDYVTGGSQSSAELIGVPVANDAHLYGFIGAVFISALLICRWLVTNKKVHPPSI